MLGKMRGWIVSILAFVWLSGSSCELGYQEVTITAQEFRFYPTEISINPHQALHLVIRNQGNEQHRFQSSLLDQAQSKDPRNVEEIVNTTEEGILLKPGKTVEVLIAPQSGVYPFRCVMEGHKGMEGVFIVEDFKETTGS